MIFSKKKDKYLSPSKIAWTRFKKHRLAMVSLWIIIVLGILSIVIPVLSSYSVGEPNIKEIFREPSKEHFMGTDEHGYDVFTRLFYGGRISLSVGLMAAIFSAFLGTIIGATAGYFEGIIDSMLMRLTDTMLSLPVLPFLLILAAVVEQRSIILIVLIISLFSWMGVARLVRGEVLSIKQREFIDACKALGSSNSRIIFKHIIPNALTPVIIATTLSLGSVIQYEAVLSYLALGIDPSTPSWGNMLSNAQEYFTKAPYLVLYPGILISITIICINFIGDGLRDALDPRQVI